MTHQKYEKYVGDFVEVSNQPLNAITYNDEDFDDQFEEDIIERKVMSEASSIPHPTMKGLPFLAADENDSIGPDLTNSRWSLYDAFATTLERFSIPTASFHFKLIIE
jgi:hypothetical protein